MTSVQHSNQSTIEQQIDPYLKLAYVLDAVAGALTPLSPMFFIPLMLILWRARRSPLVCDGLLALFRVGAITPVVLVLLPGAAELIGEAAEATVPTASTVSTEPDDDPFVEIPPTASSDGAARLRQDLARLPALVRMGDMKPWPSSPTAIPLGRDPSGMPHWIDLMRDALHVGLYAQSGAGKDSLLRAWFAWLARQNDPADLQFVFLDGKGDWLTPNLAQRTHMWRPPAGGYGEAGVVAIRTAITAVHAEAERRQGVIFGAGARTRERYQELTGVRMPLLVVIASDVMDGVAGEVEGLLISLVSKARALGIRVVVSMQTPTGKNMQWRMNLSTVIAGALQDSSQDAPALGLRDVKALRYRPSQLPPARVRPGVFVARIGAEQILVQAPFLSETTFDRFVDELPERACATDTDDESELQPVQLVGAELQPVQRGVAAAERGVANSVAVAVAPVTTAEAAFIAVQLASGATESQAAKALPNYDPRRYQEFKAKVLEVQAMIKKVEDAAQDQQ